MLSEPPASSHARPRFLELVRGAVRRRHYSYRTEQSYVQWIKRFIHFHGKRHPRELGEPEVTAYLNHLARDREVAAATQNPALAALLFLYKDVLDGKLDWLDGLRRAMRHASVDTTMIYSHVMNRGGRGVRSPLDGRGAGPADRVRQPPAAYGAAAALQSLCGTARMT